MLIRRPDTMTARPMQMEGVRDVSMRLLVGREDGAPNFSMRHFTVEPGGHTPRHQHNYEHEIFILAGEGTAESGGEIHPIRAGDVLFVEPNTTHQFRATGPAPLQFLCLVPTAYDCGGGATAPTPGS